MASALFDDEFRRELARLAWLVRRLRLAAGAGEHAGVRRGGRVEFVGHHRYAPGEEYRYIDWAAYARTGRLYVKEFAAEEGLRLEVAIDATGSMRCGVPPKFDLARRIAAALAHVVLEAGGSVRFVWLDGEGAARSPVFDRIDAIEAAFQALERTAPIPAGPGDLARALAALAAGVARGSAVVLVSDLLDRGLLPAHLAVLGRRGASVHLLHLLARADEEPPDADRAVLCDEETGATREVDLHPTSRAAYRHAVFSFCEMWRRGCDLHGLTHLLALSDQRMDEVVLDLLERGRLLSVL